MTLCVSRIAGSTPGIADDVSPRPPSAIDIWLSRGLAARYAILPEDVLPRALLDLLPDD